jgi:sporulation and cell division protein SsgA
MKVTDPVVSTVTVHINDATIPAQLFYTSTDPFSIALFCIDGELGDPSSIWYFDREMLKEGITTDPATPLGLGDVRISGADGWVYLQLDSPFGKATLRIDRPTVIEFLTAAAELVPAGTESEHFLPDLAVVEDGAA